MHDTITAVVESAHYDHDRRTEVDTGMAQLDDAHRRHAASRLRECFRELWGHEVIVTFSDNNQEDPHINTLGPLGRGTLGTRQEKRLWRKAIMSSSIGQKQVEVERSIYSITSAILAGTYQRGMRRLSALRRSFSHSALNLIDPFANTTFRTNTKSPHGATAGALVHT